jgi:hypothetical protein
MQIQQLQVAADPIQDRLLLRISTPSQEEVRVYLTRRFLRELWPHLVGMLFGHLGTQPIRLEMKEAPPAGSFEQPFANAKSSFPLGCTPLLAAEAKLEAAGDGLCRLTLKELKERSFTLTLNADLLQALCSMLRATCEQSKWDLPLDYTAPAALPGAAPSAAKAPKARLH